MTGKRAEFGRPVFSRPGHCVHDRKENLK
uniref:Uncharacterized protein n=1 Tax=Anguilla anguilla TaxID=7936 RepID=A0A0E9PJ72_ANGAN